MNQVTRNWGCEWAPDGIRVNAVSPWYTTTPMTEPVKADRSRRVFFVLISRTDTPLPMSSRDHTYMVYAGRHQEQFCV